MNDCSELVAPQVRSADIDVLNGIADVESTDRLLITGKYWTKIFE